MEINDNERPLTPSSRARPHVAAGTAWLWAREEFFEAVDVLFVDEAGQMSLANVLAIAQAAKSLVLLGDPQQLEQPMQGSHPEGTEVSALEHLLGEHETIPPDRGLFLEETWRLHPAICAFTSELFYEGRLRRAPPRAAGAGRADAASRAPGCGSCRSTHDGNQSSSPEEVESDRRRWSAELLAGGMRWTTTRATGAP